MVMEAFADKRMIKLNVGDRFKFESLLVQKIMHLSRVLCFSTKDFRILSESLNLKLSRSCSNKEFLKMSFLTSS